MHNLILVASCCLLFIILLLIDICLINPFISYQKYSCRGSFWRQEGLETPFWTERKTFHFSSFNVSSIPSPMSSLSAQQGVQPKKLKYMKLKYNTHAHIYTNIHTYIYTCTHMHIYTYTQTHICTHINMHTYTNTRTHREIYMLATPLAFIPQFILCNRNHKLLNCICYLFLLKSDSENKSWDPHPRLQPVALQCPPKPGSWSGQAPGSVTGRNNSKQGWVLMWTIHIYIHRHTHHTKMPTYIHTHIQIHTCTHMHIHTCTNICLKTHRHTHKHIHIHKNTSPSLQEAEQVILPTF